MAKTGRPKIEIDQKQFESLCGLQCTLAEIASFFQCSEDTVERWCKRTYEISFADAYKKHSAKGKMSLRRAQFRLAETNATMAIFLGKQYLGQRDDGANFINESNKAVEDGLSKSLRELGEELVSDD